MLKMPIIGVLLRKIAVARFTRTPVPYHFRRAHPGGLSITAKTSGNAVLEEALMKVRSHRRGPHYRGSSSGIWRFPCGGFE
jgi:type IV pilus assembly protein PilC